jgi:membrane-associated phospholipid phosphatase
MLKIIENNKIFFRFYFAFFILYFIIQINTNQADVVLYFSKHRQPFFDYLFNFITRLGEELAFVALALFFLLKKNYKMGLKIALTGIVVIIPVAILKEWFAHPRPVTVFEQMGIFSSINLPQGYDILRGYNSFPSGHSAAAFALWTILALNIKKVKGQLIFLSIAILVALSRVYLLCHFPEDTLFGSTIGISIALIIQYFFIKQNILKNKKMA